MGTEYTYVTVIEWSSKGAQYHSLGQDIDRSTDRFSHDD